MIRLRFLARVDEDKCNGCKLCVPVCPAGAITVTARKATVDGDRCIDCGRCIDRCNKEDAIGRAPRPSEMVRFVDHADLDQAYIKTLCGRAGILPHMPVCGCTRTTGQETIAAILKGARTPEDLCAATGLRAGCGIYCATRIFQALEACGVALENPSDRRWVKLTVGLADLTEETVSRIDMAHPACCVGEDWGRLTQRRSTSAKKEDAHV